jgi:diacylglycerol kinase (ATP)
MFTAVVRDIILNFMANPDEKILLIVNPLSGDGQAIELLPAVDNFIEQLGITREVRITESAAQAQSLAKTAATLGYNRVIAVGGDGTVNGVASGLIDTNAILGVIPAGRGNDFFRSLEIADDFEQICRIAFTGNAKLIDVGLLNKQPFFNSVGIGFAAEVANEANRLSGRHLAYLRAIYLAWKNYVGYEISLRIDNLDIKMPAAMVVVNIGKTTGGGFPVTPQALATDGKFDVCVVQKIKRSQFIAFLPKFAKGNHLRLPEIKMYRCRQLEIVSEQILPVHFDGDILHNAEGRLMIKMSRHKLNVAVRPENPHEK